jgi:hypothetical protein
MGKYILQVRVRKQDRSNPSRTVWACASNAGTLAMWPHHKAVITMRTHEATWPHHMPVFLNKAQSLLKNKSELFVVLHAPIYKVTSSSILNCTVALTNRTQSISHTQETPASITVVVPFGQEPAQLLYNLTAPFLLTFAFVR